MCLYKHTPTQGFLFLCTVLHTRSSCPKESVRKLQSILLLRSMHRCCDELLVGIAAIDAFIGPLYRTFHAWHFSSSLLLGCSHFGEHYFDQFQMCKALISDNLSDNLAITICHMRTSMKGIDPCSILLDCLASIRVYALRHTRAY